jgi:hypothetical protein
LHDVNNTTFDSGPLMTVTLNVSNTHRNPQVGGATGALGKKALVVWQTDATTIQANTVNTEVNGRVIDVASKSFSGASFPLRAMVSGNVDREYPAVTRTAEEDGSWIAVWQQFDNTNVGDDWDLQGNRITQAGAVVGSDPALSNGKPLGHSIRPRIAGQAGRYLVAWTDATGPGATTGLNVYARCFTWAENNTGPTNTEPVRLIENVLAGFGTLALDGVAHDFNTRSHWAVQYRHQHPGVVGSVRVDPSRGLRGIVEEQVCFSNDGPCWPPTWRSTRPARRPTSRSRSRRASRATRGRVNLLYANAGASAYGTPCGGTVSMMPPLAGDELYSTGIGNITPNTPRCCSCRRSPPRCRSRSSACRAACSTSTRPPTCRLARPPTRMARRRCRSRCRTSRRSRATSTRSGSGRAGHEPARRSRQPGREARRAVSARLPSVA